MRRVIVTDEFMGFAPYAFGQFSARMGEPCAPEVFFQSPDSIVHYVIGYQDAKGESESTRDLLQKYEKYGVHKDYTEVVWEVYYFSSTNHEWLPILQKDVERLLWQTYKDQGELEEALALMKEGGFYTNGALKIRYTGEEKHVQPEQA